MMYTQTIHTRATTKVSLDEIADLIAETRPCSRPPSMVDVPAVVVPRTITQVSIYAHRAPRSESLPEMCAPTMRVPTMHVVEGGS